MPGVKISELPLANSLENTDWLPLARPGTGAGVTYKILGSIFGRQSDVTALQNNKVNKGGDTMSGYLTLNGAPTQDLHAATKKYVDEQIALAKGDLTGTINGLKKWSDFNCENLPSGGLGILNP